MAMTTNLPVRNVKMLELFWMLGNVRSRTEKGFGSLIIGGGQPGVPYMLTSVRVVKSVEPERTRAARLRLVQYNHEFRLELVL